MRWWDVPAAHELERALFPDPWTVGTFWSELAGVPETRHYVVAQLEEVLIGYGGLFATRQQADIQTVAVAAGQQGRGVGGLIVAELLAEAARRGVREVLLEVRADNEAAQRLYRRLGFETIGTRRGYYRPGPVDAVVMRLRRQADRRAGA